MRARDRLGRFVDPISDDAVAPVSEEPLPPRDAVALARQLLAEGRPFSAHEVFEASWKATTGPDRDLWQGLAQVCVGLTHLERGNAVGAATLLRRGAGRLAHQAADHGIDPRKIAADAAQLADAVEQGATTGMVEI